MFLDFDSSCVTNFVVRIRIIINSLTGNNVLYGYVNSTPSNFAISYIPMGMSKPLTSTPIM